jgi:predicted AAA+ superfamily ATPase
VYKLEKLEIITFSEETVLNENGVIIQVIPVWKWLLE